MAGMRGDTAGLLMLGLLLLSAAATDVVRADVTCGTVSGKLSPCLPYVTGAAPKPASASPCCSGLRSLDALASQSTINRREICSCLQNTAKILKPNPSVVPALINTCGVRNSFSPNENCATIP